MKLLTAQIEWDGYRVISLPVDFVLPVYPLMDWPHGRKALAMHDLWSTLRVTAAAGVLWMDNDVAADPDDLEAMSKAVEAEPHAMHTGWVKLWPASTGRPDWMWSHRAGELAKPIAHQGAYEDVAYIATGFLWTPRRLLDLACPQLRQLRWEQVDVFLSEIALGYGIPIRTVAGCYPKHLHF